MKILFATLIASASAINLSSAQNRLSFYINKIEGPEDLVQLKGIDSDLSPDSTLP